MHFLAAQSVLGIEEKGVARNKATMARTTPRGKVHVLLERES